MATVAAGQVGTLAALVRVERRRRGWSRAQLAERADCKARTVQDIELGRRRPQGATLRRLAGALGVPFGALLAAVAQRG